MELPLFVLTVLPLGLGLLGFIEPCTLGSTMLFLYYLEGKPKAEQIRQTIWFTLFRGIFMGLLGVVAATVGAIFVGAQKAAWIVMGLAYVGLGIAYILGRVEVLKKTIGVGLGRLQGAKGTVVIASIFAFNIPACAGPLLVALLGAASMAGEARQGAGFIMLGIFGLALSLPIIAAVLSARGRYAIERLGRWSATTPKVLGLIFVVLGAWSIRFALVAEIL